MTMLRFTPIYAGILACLIIYLAYRVTIFRRSEAVALGDDKGSNAMKRAVRAHANAVENTPIALLLLLMLELNHLTPWLLNASGMLLIAGRGLHAWGLSQRTGPSFGRFYGTILTWLSILIMAVLNVAIIITR